jgi:hypothetical protein
MSMIRPFFLFYFLFVCLLFRKHLKIEGLVQYAALLQDKVYAHSGKVLVVKEPAAQSSDKARLAHARVAQENCLYIRNPFQKKERKKTTKEHKFFVSRSSGTRRWQE